MRLLIQDTEHRLPQREAQVVREAYGRAPEPDWKDLGNIPLGRGPLSGVLSGEQERAVGHTFEADMVTCAKTWRQ